MHLVTETQERNMTFSVMVDGFAFDHDMVEEAAKGLVELLKDSFPFASVEVVAER
jgi:hypothetical protein